MKTGAASLCAAGLALALAVLLGSRVVLPVWAGLTLGLLLALSLTPARPRSLAAAVAMMACALAADAISGRRGTVDVAPGAPRRSMAEARGNGASRLRPLGFTLSTDGERVFADGEPLHPDRATAWRGHRLALGPRLRSGEAERARLAIGDAHVDLRPGIVVRHGALELTLAGYFPELAFDEQGRPFTLSPQPRQPAVVVDVAHGDSTSSVLLKRGVTARPDPSLPPLTLVDVTPGYKRRVQVTREPFAVVVLAASLVALVGVVRVARAGGVTSRVLAINVGAAVVAGVWCWWTSGSYAGTTSSWALAAALVSLAVQQLVAWRRRG